MNPKWLHRVAARIGWENRKIRRKTTFFMGKTHGFQQICQGCQGSLWFWIRCLEVEACSELQFLILCDWSVLCEIKHTISYTIHKICSYHINHCKFKFVSRFGFNSHPCTIFWMIPFKSVACSGTQYTPDNWRTTVYWGKSRVLMLCVISVISQSQLQCLSSANYPLYQLKPIGREIFRPEWWHRDS